MALAVKAVRIVIGLLLFVFGLNGFLSAFGAGFVPQPTPPPDGGAFLGALVDGGFLPIVSLFETVIGALLLTGRFVPLALVMLVPVSIGIVTYHLRFDPAGVPAYVVAAANVFLLWAYRSHLMPLLTPKAEPPSGGPGQGVGGGVRQPLWSPDSTTSAGVGAAPDVGRPAHQSRPRAESATVWRSPSKTNRNRPSGSTVAPHPYGRSSRRSSTHSPLRSR